MDNSQLWTTNVPSCWRPSLIQRQISLIIKGKKNSRKRLIVTSECCQSNCFIHLKSIPTKVTEFYWILLNFETGITEFSNTVWRNMRALRQCWWVFELWEEVLVGSVWDILVAISVLMAMLFLFAERFVCVHLSIWLSMFHLHQLL